MENTVNVVGKIVDVTEAGDDGKINILLEVARRYGTDGVSLNMHNVTVLGGGTVQRLWESTRKSGKPLYGVFRAVIANKKFADDDKYANHAYLVALASGVFGVVVDSQWTSAIFEGEIVAAQQKFTAKGTEFISLLVRNKRTVGDMEISSSVNVTIYDMDLVPFEALKKGAKVIVSGRLDSYESKNNPGKFVTGIVANSIALSGVENTEAEQAATSVAADVEDADDDINLEDLDF